MFNNIELSDADEYCESFTGTNRILPNDGTKRFSLSNFIAKEYELTLRDLPQEVIIADQVKISIGTLVDEENEIYEYVPIGIFNIQDTPTNDNNKITIKLRDNRVKFDFKYNAQPLIESSGGSATLGQILNDICQKANVVNNVGTFDGENIEVAIYDSTINATNYVAYILEQGGYIPTIDRAGNLIKIDLRNLATHKIPLDIVENYEIGTLYNIERVVYESGIIKYETSSDTSLNTLYLDGNNMYITTQAQVNNVYNKLNLFEIDSAKIGKVLGNPAIDPYDIIEIYGYYEEDEDGNEVFVPDENTIVLRTLANNTYTYNGINRNTFDTEIGLEERKENVTLSGEAAFKTWAKTEIDNINVEIRLSAGKIEEVEQTIWGGYVLTTDEFFLNNKVYYYKSNNEYLIKEMYYLTGDATFQSGKTYYIYNNGEYQEASVVVGDTIPADTYYETLIGTTIPNNTYYEYKEDTSLEQRLNEAEATLTEQGAKLDVKTSKIDKNGNATSLKVTSYTLDSEGFTIDDGSGFKSQATNTGQYYYSNGNLMGQYTKDGSIQKDLALLGTYYYGIDENINIEDFTKDKALFISQLYEYDDGTTTETGVGHFYIGD